MYWAPLTLATADLQAQSKAAPAVLGAHCCKVYTAQGSDGEYHRYVVDFNNPGPIYSRLPPVGKI